MQRRLSPSPRRRTAASFMSWKSSSTLLAFVLKPTRAGASCEPFLAGGILGLNMDVSANEYSTSEFECEGDDAYITSISLNAVWWMDALRFNCSDGQQSPKFGNELRTDFEVAEAGGGWTAMRAFDIDMDDFLAYPGIPSVYVYDEDSGYPSGEWVGPFGGGGDYSDEPTTSECGLGGYAVGLTVFTNVQYVLGLRLLCRNITLACPAPQGLLVSAVTLEPSLSPVPTTYTQLPTTPSPTSEQARTEGQACDDTACGLAYCCSEERICGSDESFCRSKHCCGTGDDDTCVLAPTSIKASSTTVASCFSPAPSSRASSTSKLDHRNPICESSEELHWYETPLFVGLSSALAVVSIIVGACYASCRSLRKRRNRRTEEQASTGPRPYPSITGTGIPQASARP